ncbi:MAG: flagellar protein FlaG [Bryobacteraceae bacterium]
MDVSATSLNLEAARQSQPAPEHVAERRELIQAAKTINGSGVLGDQNELVFAVDRATHRAIMRVVDRETQEVVLQLPPEYVLHLAEDLGNGNR